MEPHQEAPSPPQHIPSPARHHHYLTHTSSSPTLSDKRHLRRALGSPYPQSISIPPPPTLLSSSPTRQLNGTANIPPSRPPIPPSAASPQLTTSQTFPLASPFEPPPTPRTPTSSLARRRRSTVSNNSGTFTPTSYPSPDTMAMPPPPLISTGHGTLHYLQSQQQQNNRHQPTSAASTPGQLSSAANFWASGSGEAKYNHGSSLFIKDDAGLGGSWVGWSTGNRAPTRREHEEPDQLELDMEVAMEDDSDPEDQMTQEAINAQLDGAMSQDRNDARLEAEDSLARIAQAMTLLSLAPAGNPPQIQYTTGNSVSNNNSTGDDMDWPPHPTPESLLRESLRQSFEALRILKELDKKFVMGGVEARQKPVASPISRRHSLRHEEEEGKTSVVDVLRSYERAVEGVKSAQEVLKWAEHWIKEEGDRTRERLLKS